MGGRCCAALTRQAGAGRPGRRSADLHVGAPAGRTRGLSAAGAGSLRRRRLSCLINLRPRGGSRWEQTARASRRPSDHWRCDRTRALERLPHRCAVRRRPLTPPRPRWHRPLDAPKRFKLLRRKIMNLDSDGSNIGPRSFAGGRQNAGG